MKPKLSEQEISESCVQILRTFQGMVNKAVGDAGLKGNEPHVLNIINAGLFGLLCQARLFIPEKPKAKEPEKKP